MENFFRLILVAWTLVACGAAQEFGLSSGTRTAASATALRSLTSSRASASATATRTPCGYISYYEGGTAEVGYACLQSVPFKKQPALDTITQFRKFTEFQSSLTTLKNPPSGYPNPAVDLLSLLDDITSKINAGSYPNQYEFEKDLSNVTIQSRDGHYAFPGMTFLGALRFKRGSGTSLALVSSSSDGSALPQIYLASDIRRGVSNPSPVSQIDGKPVLDFIQQESLNQNFQDPDTRFNVLFARYAAESSGSFINPWFYPGPNTTLTFANSTTRTYTNYALIPDDVDWDDVTDGESFYSEFVEVSDTDSFKAIRKRSLRTVRRSVPIGYPKPVIQHTDYDVNLGGFYVPGDAYSDIAVLSLNTFDWEYTSDGIEFQSMIAKFLSQASSAGKKKIIVDVSSNGGGVLLSGYDAFKQFFPGIEPDIGSRMRATEYLNILGSQFGTIKTYQPNNNTGLAYGYLTASSIYRSSIHYQDNLNENLQNFTSWEDMYGPVQVNGDNYTNTLRNNFSNPLLFYPLVMSGYGSKSNIKQYFAAQDIVLLHDGYCGSTCAIFSDLMRREGGVKSYVMGGRPQYGPMQPVGGTKGALYLSYSTLIRYVATVLGDFGTSDDQEKWADILPSPMSIQSYIPPSVNFRDGLHPGDTTPMQFLNESAHCRLFYTPAMLQNVTNIWQRVADVAFLGKDYCVTGSKTNGSTVSANPPATVNSGGGTGTSGNGASGTSSGSSSTSSDKNAGVRLTSIFDGQIWALLLASVFVIFLNL